jgi:signal transduction histidine kinase
MRSAAEKKGPLRVLVVEDSRTDFELLVRELRKSNYEIIAERVETPEAMDAALADGSWNVVFSDWSLPRFSALAALALLKQRGIDLPFIIVSGTIGEETAVEALKSGADDFLLKDRLARLIPALERELRENALRRERDEMQQQLMISDRMASVGILAAGVAHEINNPLACIIANLELSTTDIAALTSRIQGTEELREQIRDARDAAERVRQIVRDLKIFSRSEENKRAPVDVQHVIESSLRMAWNEIRHRARLIKEYETVPTVTANESRLGQVFLNLIVNAAQAITEGLRDENEIRITLRREGEDRVLVEIADSGSGISEDTLSKVFTPFFTTKPRGVGTGLGLTICHRIISELGGEIAVRSSKGRGSVFRVLLPADPPTTTHAAPRTASLPPARRRGRVLVIDDETMITSAVSRTLSREHDVTPSLSASDAVQRIQNGERYDVILCDLMMPQMTGMDLHATIARIAPDQAERIVFLTGGAFTPTAREFLERVPNPRIEKPFGTLQLRAMVNDRVR